ncbi:MAG: response regulator [Microthrixaceae bacterium]
MEPRSGRGRIPDDVSAEEARPGGPSAPLRVVVAEDDAIIRMDLCQILREEGYEVVADVGRGDRAVETVEALRPDVALLDVKMPGLDGITAAARIGDARWCAVVLVTAFSQRSLIESARDAGVMGYVVKPFQRADLVPAIEMAVARFEESRALASEAADATERLAVRTLVDRAKARLIAERGWSEAEAFHHIQRSAMDRRVPVRTVASEILDADAPPRR